MIELSANVYHRLRDVAEVISWVASGLILSWVISRFIYYKRGK